MRWTLVIALVFMAIGDGKTQTKVSFDEGNALPQGWDSGITGKGAAKWEIVSDDTAPPRAKVLKQSGEATFCWAANTDERIKDTGAVGVWTKGDSATLFDDFSFGTK